MPAMMTLRPARVDAAEEKLLAALRGTSLRSWMCLRFLQKMDAEQAVFGAFFGVFSGKKGENKLG